MKKLLNEAAISNELREGSVFFRRSNSVEQKASNTGKNYTRSNVTPVTRDTDVTNVTDDTYVTEQPKHREIERRPLEIYKDQHKTLLNLKARSVLDGSPKIIGDFVREALDDYFIKRGIQDPKQ
jgi:hypothetical protein